jgi:hypothetical protein
MSTPTPVSELWDLLETLATDLESTAVRVPDQSERAGDGARRSLLADIRRYFGSRLNAPGAPLVVAVLGPSGAGVSTVANALAGEVVSAAGVLRPTTRRPRMWAPRSAQGRWWDDLRHRFGVGEGEDVVIGGAGTDEAGFVLVDLPAALGPSESLDLATSADLCLFVTSPTRYADAEAAAVALSLFERGVPTWYVLNKLPADAALRFEMIEAYAGLLASWDLIETSAPGAIDTALWTADGPIADDGLPLMRSRLASLQDPEARRTLLEDALAARLAAVSVRTEELAERIEDDRDSLLDLDSLARDAYTGQADRLVEDLDSGAFAGLASHSTWSEAAVDLTGIVTRRAGLAAHAATDAWAATSAGRAVLADGGGALRRHGEQAAFDGQGLLEAWLLELGDEAAGSLAPKRVSSRKRSRMANWLWPLVVDPERAAPRRLNRYLGTKLPTVVAEGRVRLGIAMVAAVARDADRFDDFLGPHPEVARLVRIITTASVLSDIDTVRLDSSLVPGWGESAEPGTRELEIVVGADDDAAPAGDDAAPVVDAVAAPADSSPSTPSSTDRDSRVALQAIESLEGSVSLDEFESEFESEGVVTTDGLAEASVFELPEVPPPPPPPAPGPPLPEVGDSAAAPDEVEASEGLEPKEDGGERVPDA